MQNSQLTQSHAPNVQSYVYSDTQQGEEGMETIRMETVKRANNMQSRTSF